jgi:hypothetical protein
MTPCFVDLHGIGTLTVAELSVQAAQSRRRAQEASKESQGAQTSVDVPRLVYTDDAAVQFAARATGLPETTCAAVLRARDRYHLALGIFSADAENGESAESIRDRYPALFPSATTAPAGGEERSPLRAGRWFTLANMERRYVATALVTTFIMADARLDEETVIAVQDADREYMRRCGIVD